MTAVVITNVVFALVTAAFGVVALTRPLLLIPGDSLAPGVTYYAFMYGVRAVLLGLATAVTLVVADAEVSVPLLVTSGLVQAADSGMGIRRHIARMAIAAGVTAAIHLGSAWWILAR